MVVLLITTQALRIFIYGLITIGLTICSPCIMYNIVKKRRRRQFAQLNILNNQLRNEQNPNREEFLREYNNYLAIRQEFEGLMREEGAQQPEDNRNFMNRLANILDNYNRPLPFTKFEDLKRTEYEDEKDDLPYEECPICIMPFSDATELKLIYLP
mmetsp:Transcript_31364/g.27709  ORF Transcript_31364/g.27709 Transcript_31364/m.27709 type:complete len:156 (+) Transcript_31364:358-825(+)